MKSDIARPDPTDSYCKTWPHRFFNKYSESEDDPVLEVYCCNLKSGEVDELIILLEEFNFKFIFVDKNSIKAVKEDNYRKVYQARKKLEKEGFSWSEKLWVTLN